MQDTQTQLDPQAVNLTKAIRQTESGGNFTAQGKSGEYGAYQFTQPTWDTYSKEAGINVPLDQATPEQQNQVAYTKIKQWKDAGNNIGQIASMWNAGEGNKEAYLDNNTGTNKYGVHYDTGAYAKSVATAYQTLKNGGQVQADPNNPSSTAAPQNSSEIQSATNNQATDTSPQWQNPLNGSDYKDLLNNPITNDIRKVGSALTFGGTEQLGAQTGQALSNVVTGNYSTSPSVSQALLGGAKTLGGVGLLASGGLLGGAKATAETAMSSKPIMELLAKDTGIDATNLSASTIRQTLQTALNSQTLDSDTQTLAEQALKELESNPSQVVKQSGSILKGLKHLGEAGVAYKFLSPFAKSLYDKYIGSQIGSPNPNNEITVNPAP